MIKRKKNSCIPNCLIQETFNLAILKAIVEKAFQYFIHFKFLRNTIKVTTHYNVITFPKKFKCVFSVVAEFSIIFD